MAIDSPIAVLGLAAWWPAFSTLDGGVTRSFRGFRLVETRLTNQQVPILLLTG